jgi:curved DNA-binding protein
MTANQSAADDRHSQPRAGSDQERKVEVTLQEAYTGTTRLVELAGGGCFAVKIPPGVATGTKVRYTGYGLSGRAGGAPGDMYLVIEVKPCPSFTRRGNDLYHRLFVPLAELAPGGIDRVRTLDGRILNLSLPPGTREGHQFRLAGEGMPQLQQPDRRGDLYVTVAAAVPEPRTPGQQRAASPREATRETARKPDASGWTADEIIGLVIFAVFFIVVGIGAGLLLYWLMLD